VQGQGTAEVAEETPPEMKGDPEPVTETDEAKAEPVEAAPLPPAVTLSEIHVAPGATCRAALFDPALRELRPLAWTPEGFPPSTFAPSLCGIALATADGSPPPALTVTPEDAFLIAEAPPGSLHAILREGVQNVVYTFPDPRDGATQPLSHEINTSN
jgi:hypothetical protein